LLTSAGLFFFAWKAYSAPPDAGKPTAPDAAEAPPWPWPERAQQVEPLPPGWLRSIPASPGKPVYDLPLVITVDLPPPAPDSIATPTAAPGDGKAATSTAGKTAQPAAQPALPDVLNSIWHSLSELSKKAPVPPAAKAEPKELAKPASPAAAPAVPAPAVQPPP